MLGWRVWSILDYLFFPLIEKNLNLIMISENYNLVKHRSVSTFSYSIVNLIFVRILYWNFISRELLSHNDIVFNDNGTVSSIPKHPLVWDEEKSMGRREDDVFILPNIALLVSPFFYFKLWTSLSLFIFVMRLMMLL